MHGSGLSASDGALLDAVRTLRWPARKRSPAGLPGEHLSRALGGAAEFTEYRAYRPGDDPARLDWKLLARSDRAYIRLSQERTVLPTVVVVDASASMAYPAATVEKWHHARRVALGLAAAAHRGGDPVGLAIATADGAVRLPPRTRSGAVNVLARALGAVAPAGAAPLAPLLGMLRALGRLVLVSDFLESESGEDALLAKAAELGAAGCEVFAVHVVHPVERQPPRRAMRVFDPEHPAVRRPLVDATRRRYTEAFAAWRVALARSWRQAGAVYLESGTEEPAAHAVRRLVASTAAGADPVRPGAEEQRR